MHELYANAIRQCYSFNCINCTQGSTKFWNHNYKKPRNIYFFKRIEEIASARGCPKHFKWNSLYCSTSFNRIKIEIFCLISEMDIDPFESYSVLKFKKSRYLFLSSIRVRFTAITIQKRHRWLFGNKIIDHEIPILLFEMFF